MIPVNITEKAIISAFFLPLESEIILITISPMNEPKLNIDWIVSLAHSN